MNPRAAARDALDRIGLLATVDDVRARLRYAVDRDLRARNRALVAAHDSGEPPLPPPELVYAVAGHFDVGSYVSSGRDHARSILGTLESQGVRMERLGALLDFGCGCGRVLRHWTGLTDTAVHGSDVNPRLVEWCRGALPFVIATTNGPAPPLQYPEATFDAIYAISVFTHLEEPLQHAWMRELERVLARDGVLLVTTKGASRASSMTEAERARFDAGQLVVQAGRYSGKNLCAAFHPEPYLRDVLAGDLDVLAFHAADGATWTQDVTVLRKG